MVLKHYNCKIVSFKNCFNVHQCSTNTLYKTVSYAQSSIPRKHYILRKRYDLSSKVAWTNHRVIYSMGQICEYTIKYGSKSFLSLNSCPTYKRVIE